MKKSRMYKRGKRTLLSAVLAVSLSAAWPVPVTGPAGSTVAAVKAETICPTYQEAYDAMMALQETYKEGMPWTNFTPYGRDGELGSAYKWKGGKIKGAESGVGCAAFVFLLSDAAFGNLPSRTIDNGSFRYDDIKVGDILRVNNSHFVIILKKSASGVIVAEANYNKSVHWGRAISKAEVMNANFIVTRYPENYVPADDPNANVVTHSGKEGNLAWTLTGGGVLTVSGSGAIPDYSINDNSTPSWKTYEDSISTIVIENGVTSIGAYAFYESKAISVYIPDSVTSIGQSAFYGADIVSATIPGSVGTIGNDAFRNCANLTSATVSEGVKSIGERAFYGCTSLAYIDFPSSITSVGAAAFTSCEKMSRVRFMPGTGKVTIGDNLFSQCWRLVDVTLPQTSDRISAGMFQSCSLLPALYIPATVTEIGENPFTSCGNLGVIYFGGSEAQWKEMETPSLKYSLQSTGTKVEYNAEFQNPFAPVPDDPGDFIPEEDPAPSVHEHHWLTEWTHNATHHWHECSSENCPVTDNGQKDGYGEHSYGDWVVDTAATALQDGSQHRTCRSCSYVQTSSIPATGDGETDSGKPDNPGKPDDSDKPDNSDKPDDSNTPGNSGGSTTPPDNVTGGNGSSNSGGTGGSGIIIPANPGGSNSNNGSSSGTDSDGNTSAGSNSDGAVSPDNPSSDTNNSGNTVPEEPETSDSSDDKIGSADTSNSTDNGSSVDTVTEDVKKPVTRKQKKELKNYFNKQLNKQLDTKLNKLLKKQLKKQQSKKELKKQLQQQLKTRLRKQLKAEFKEQLGSNFEKEFKKLLDDQFDKKFNQWFQKQYKKQNKK